MANESQPQELFKRLKAVCVPLLGASQLSPVTTLNVLKLLTELLAILLDAKASGIILTPSLISYTFFPLSTILRRNAASDIPDQILEKIFIILSNICDDWWWDCDFAIWEQIFMFCGAIIGGIDAKGKEKDRDEETKEAAARCLITLLRERNLREELLHSPSSVGKAQSRLEAFQTQARTNKFLPILGQTLDSILITVESRHLPLQRASLDLLSLLIGTYAPEDLIPAVLPGVISRMTRVSLGTSKGKGWANGDVVKGALEVMQFSIVKAAGDDICIREGAICDVVDLEDLAQPTRGREEPTLTYEAKPYSIPRTPSWLRGTSSQLIIAMNTLTPLTSHPTPSALLALSNFSEAVIKATSMTLPQAQPLLLRFLLSLSNSSFTSVSGESHRSLMGLLTAPSKAQHSLHQTLMRSTSDNLSALPRLLPTHADAKVEHVAGLVEAACRLVSSKGQENGLSAVSTGIGKLLGPTGGIEKWGWNLLSVLEFVEPPVTVTTTSSAMLLLESNPESSILTPFPELSFKNVFSNSTRDALERMFCALGRAGGDGCLFSVEWFANVGRNGVGSRSVAATWCACRLLEGVADISLLRGTSGDAVTFRRSKRLAKLARSLAKNIAELWDEPTDGDESEILNDSRERDEAHSNILVEHTKGVSSINDTLRITRPSRIKEKSNARQPVLHKALSLQILAVSAGILQAQFNPLLLYTLYPVLHSLVSLEAYLSSTALATLNFITIVTSYASPANLLLSNFDYALDSVSRRLSRRWLDIDATKVLTLIIRLVGSDVVDRAGDVVEECFDRLDEYHGYGIFVEGLIGVLGEVISVIKADIEIDPINTKESPPLAKRDSSQSLNDLFTWISHRHDNLNQEDATDYGPAPREAWGTKEEPDAEDEDDPPPQEPDPNAEPPTTPIQALTKQIVSRSLYFLTHGSPIIRARIISLLSSSVSVLPESAILPSIHSAWPFILNRLGDPEPFVISATAVLIETLATHVGSFMFRRIWDDVWPRFRVLLAKLDAADATSALSRRGYGAVGTETAYSHSHRLYRSLIKTMTATVKGVHQHDVSVWQVLLAFRRFLHKGAHEELQRSARELYCAVALDNPDVVWLALSSTQDDTYVTMQFLRTPQWDIEANASVIFQSLMRVHL